MTSSTPRPDTTEAAERVRAYLEGRSAQEAEAGRSFGDWLAVAGRPGDPHDLTVADLRSLLAAAAPHPPPASTDGTLPDGLESDLFSELLSFYGGALATDEERDACGDVLRAIRPHIVRALAAAPAPSGDEGIDLDDACRQWEAEGRIPNEHPAILLLRQERRTHNARFLRMRTDLDTALAARPPAPEVDEGPACPCAADDYDGTGDHCTHWEVGNLPCCWCAYDGDGPETCAGPAAPPVGAEAKTAPTGWPCPSCGNSIGISGIRTGICTTEGCERWMTRVEVPQAPHGPAPDGVEVAFWTNCMRCGGALYYVEAEERSYHDATDLRECSPIPPPVGDRDAGDEGP